MRGIHWSFWLFHSQRPNNTEFWCFDCCYPEKAVEQTVDLSVLGMARCSCGVTFMTMLQNVFFSNDRLTLRYRDIKGSKWLCIYIYIYIYIYHWILLRENRNCWTFIKMWLYVILVEESIDPSVQVIITRLIWIKWTLMVDVRER